MTSKARPEQSRRSQTAAVTKATDEISPMREEQESQPRVFSIASVVVNLPMRVPQMPKRGSTVIASAINSEVGGAFNVMSAIARQGVKVVNASPLGTGPNSMLVRRAMYREGIAPTSAEVVGDTGTKLIFIEEDGHNTSILSPGVESDVEQLDLGSLDVQDGDYIYLSAGDLAFAGYRDTVISWLRNNTKDLCVVLAVSPLIDAVSREAISHILPHVSVLTMNEREHLVLMDLLGLTPHDFPGLYNHGLPEDAYILHRAGVNGCFIYSSDHDYHHHVKALPSEGIDTTGVGDSHTGVLIASLASGASIEEAVWRGNIAGALVVAKHGSATCPSVEDIDQVIANLDRLRH